MIRKLKRAFLLLAALFAGGAANAWTPVINEITVDDQGNLSQNPVVLHQAKFSQWLTNENYSSCSEVRKYTAGTERYDRPMITKLVYNDQSLFLTNLQTGTTYDDKTVGGKNVTFTTAAHPPMTLLAPVYGTADDFVNNFRDLGGWKLIGDNKKRTKFGVFFRSAHWDEYKSSTARRQTCPMNREFHIKTEIDLRRDANGSPAETQYVKANTTDNIEEEEYMDKDGGPHFTSSPSVSDDSVRYFNITIGDYFQKPAGNSTCKGLKKIFHILGKKEYHPVVFHCAGGKDRTGYVAILIEALCGMYESDIYRDHLATCFANASDPNKNVDHYLNGVNNEYDGIMGSEFNKYGDSMAGHARAYLESIGVTTEEISVITDALTGETPAQVLTRVNTALAANANAEKVSPDETDDESEDVGGVVITPVTDAEVLARGGDDVYMVTENGVDYYVHRFTSTDGNKTFVNNSGRALNIRYLVVGGGGAGGDSTSNATYAGGGGGGGGGVKGASTEMAAGASWTINVGQGGAIPTHDYGVARTAAGSSSINFGSETLTVPGGGAGGCTSGNYPATAGAAGGGSPARPSTVLDVPGEGTYVSVCDGETYSPAHSGGAGGSDTLAAGGGGAAANGCAGGVDKDGHEVNRSGDGGMGIISDISGVGVMYGAGGGGGGTASIDPGNGANNFGRGGTPTEAAQNGAPNTGCGGGGAGDDTANAGEGGSGVVIIRYAVAPEQPETYTATFMNDTVTFATQADVSQATKPSPDPTKDGYSFVGWKVNGTGDVVTFPYTLSENTTFTAYFESTPGPGPTPSGDGKLAEGGDYVHKETIGDTDYWIHEFSNGTANVTFENTSGASLEVEYLVVGGGGAGGDGYSNYGAGGGGGGGVCAASKTLSAGATLTITVGKGGSVVGKNKNEARTPAEASSITDGGTFTETVPGGGAGACLGDSRNATEGAAGGGGGGRGSGTHNGAAGNYDSGYGENSGGKGNPSSSGSTVYGGGGGGGAKTAGGAGTTSAGGAGGAGIPSSITGTEVIYGAGGNGGPVGEASGTDGVNGTGCGGSGSGSVGNSKTVPSTAGNGGDGIVIIRYVAGETPATQKYTLTITQVDNCTITVKNNGVAVSSDDQFDEGTILTVNRVPASGYQLSNCLAEEEITMDTDREVTAAVTAIPVATYTATFMNGEAVYETQSEVSQATKPSPSPTKSGYSFVGWKVNGTGDVVTFPYALSADTTFNAYFVEAAPGEQRATGGTVASYTSGGTLYYVHTFDSPAAAASFVNTCGEPFYADYLIVGGGGAGGSSKLGYFGGGGGAGGGVVTGNALMGIDGSWEITIGAGGTAPNSVAERGVAGSSSIDFGTETRTAMGGGAGACAGDGSNGHYATFVANGGGGATDSLGAYFQYSTGARGDGGYAGGNGAQAYYYNGIWYIMAGGGAGAGGKGGNGDASSIYKSGDGGQGFVSSITGEPVGYAGGGGGGGGSRAYTAMVTGGESYGIGIGLGTAGGGDGGWGNKGSTGNGNLVSQAAGNGVRGGGGGGAGAGVAQAGNGGDGIVIIRYAASTGAVTEKWTVTFTKDGVDDTQITVDNGHVLTSEDIPSGYPAGEWDNGSPVGKTILEDTTFNYTCGTFWNVTFSSNGVQDDAFSTKVLNGEMLPDDSIPDWVGTWDADPVGAVITCTTNFNCLITQVWTVKFRKVGKDGPAEMANYTTTVVDGYTLTSEQIPEFGSIVGGVYKGGTWDKDPHTTIITKNETFTWTPSSGSGEDVTAMPFRVVGGAEGSIISFTGSATGTYTEGGKTWVPAGTTVKLSAVDVTGATVLGCWRDDTTGEFLYPTDGVLFVTPDHDATYTACFGTKWVYNSTKGTLSNGDWIFTVDKDDNDLSIRLVFDKAKYRDDGYINFATPIVDTDGKATAFRITTFGKVRVENETDKWSLFGKNCAAVKTVVPPKDLTTVGYQAFHRCGNLSGFDGILYLKDGLYLGGNCFEYCGQITNIVFAGRVDNDDHGFQFSNVTNLTGFVNLPTGIAEIPASYFRECRYITGVDLTGVDIVCRDAFEECKSLKTVIGLADIKEVGYRSFNYCCITGEYSFTYLENIPYRAFGGGVGAYEEVPGEDGKVVKKGEGHNEFTQIWLPAATNVGYCAFGFCPLTNVVFGTEQVTFYDIGGLDGDKGKYQYGQQTFTGACSTNNGCWFRFPGKAPLMVVHEHGYKDGSPDVGYANHAVGRGMFGSTGSSSKDGISATNNKIFIQGVWENDPAGWQKMFDDQVAEPCGYNAVRPDPELPADYDLRGTMKWAHYSKDKDPNRAWLVFKPMGLYFFVK